MILSRSICATFSTKGKNWKLKLSQNKLFLKFAKIIATKQSDFTTPFSCSCRLSIKIERPHLLIWWNQREAKLLVVGQAALLHMVTMEVGHAW